MIDKQVLQRILISLGGTDVSASKALVWREDGENPRVQMGDRHTLSHNTIVDHADRIRVAAEITECIVYYATWTPVTASFLKLNCKNDQKNYFLNNGPQSYTAVSDVV